MNILIPVLFIVLSIPLYGQDTIKKLPALVGDGTYVVTEEVFIQSVDDEIKQRHRFKRIRKIALEKKELEKGVDSLLVKLSALEDERDSLYTTINEDILLINNESKTKLIFLEAEIRKLKRRVYALDERKKKINRRFITSLIFNIGLFTILIAVL